MNVVDFIRGRKEIKLQEGEGLNLAIFSIEECKDRFFSYRGMKKSTEKSIEKHCDNFSETRLKTP